MGTTLSGSTKGVINLVLTLPSGRGARLLLFGAEGSGKTEIAAGIARMTQRYLYIDNEASADDYPLHRYTKAEPWGLVALDRTNAGEVQRLLDDELARQAAGKGNFDVIVLDGITEQSYITGYAIDKAYVKKHGTEGAQERTLRRFGDLLVAMVELVQTLVALANYGVGIIVTAMAERGTDPDIPEGVEARPLAYGGIRHLLGKQFTCTVYVESKPEKGKDGVWYPRHLYHMVKDGPWHVKNRYEAEWSEDSQSFRATLVNPTTEQLVALVLKAAQRKAAKNIKEDSSA